MPWDLARSIPRLLASGSGTTWKRHPFTGSRATIQPASSDSRTISGRSPPRPSIDMMGRDSLRERSSTVGRAGGRPRHRLFVRQWACHPSGAPMRPFAAICARLASGHSSRGTIALSPQTRVASMWLHQPTPAHEQTTCPRSGTRTTCHASSVMLRTRKLCERLCAAFRLVPPSCRSAPRPRVSRRSS